MVQSSVGLPNDQVGEEWKEEPCRPRSRNIKSANENGIYRVFNTGSPYNVPAGHGANLDGLIAHYKKKNAEQDAKTRARMETRTTELRQEQSATLSGANPPGRPLIAL